MFMFDNATRFLRRTKRKIHESILAFLYPFVKVIGGFPTKTGLHASLERQSLRERGENMYEGCTTISRSSQITRSVFFSTFVQIHTVKVSFSVMISVHALTMMEKLPYNRRKHRSSGQFCVFPLYLFTDARALLLLLSFSSLLDLTETSFVQMTCHPRCHP